jgi:hypothetical protein
MEEKAMYSRTILLTAASLAVAGMANAANAESMTVRQLARAQVSAALHIHHYRLLADPYFTRGHYVARSIDPSGRVVLVEIDPKDGALMGEILI